MSTTITAAPSTVRGLFNALHAFGPVADGEELVFDSDPSNALIPALKVLHTGVRALLVDRKWFGERSDWPGITVLNPSMPIPCGISLLCVEGDGCWDRIHPAARLNLPHLFVTDKAKQTLRRSPQG